MKEPSQFAAIPESQWQAALSASLAVSEHHVVLLINGILIAFSKSVASHSHYGTTSSFWL
jgi:hypothetical protein